MRRNYIQKIVNENDIAQLTTNKQELQNAVTEWYITIRDGMMVNLQKSKVMVTTKNLEH